MSTKKNKHNTAGMHFLFYLIILLFLLSCSTDKAARKEGDMFDPEGSFKEANDLIQKEDYEGARKILETIKTKDASQKYAVLAKLRIADTYFEDEYYEEAAVEYESFLNMHPYHNYASYAQYQLAMSYFNRIKTVDISYAWAQRALKEFQNLRKRYPRNPYMDIVDTRVKMCMSVLAEYEYYVGNFYFEKGSYQAAIQRFNGILNDYPDSSRISDALYFMGISYENLGKREEAINVLTALIERFPTIEVSSEARKLISSFEEEK